MRTILVRAKLFSLRVSSASSGIKIWEKPTRTLMGTDFFSLHVSQKARRIEIRAEPARTLMGVGAKYPPVAVNIETHLGK